MRKKNYKCISRSFVIKKKNYIIYVLRNERRKSQVLCVFI